MATWNRTSFTDVQRTVRAILEAEPLPEGWTAYMRWTDASRSGFGQGDNRGAFGLIEVFRYAGRQRISRQVGGRHHGGEERTGGRGWVDREAAAFVEAIRAETVAGEEEYQALLQRLKESLPNRNMLRATLNLLAAKLDHQKWDIATGDIGTNADVRRVGHDAKNSLNKGIAALDKLETAADD